jgi:hypothetical protein
MKLFKQSANSKLYAIQELTEEDILALFNVCINYKPYIDELLKQPNFEMKKAAPGTDANQIRHNIKIQAKACMDYIGMLNETLNQGKKQN